MAGLMSLLSGVGSAAAGYDLSKDLRQAGKDAANKMDTLAGSLQDQSAFRGYGVQTGIGNSTVTPQGSLNLGVGQDAGMMGLQQQALQQGGQFGNYANQAAQNSMMNPAAREQSIYNRAMAMQQPGLDQQRAQQQAREFAMGRGGVRGSQFGGTAEDAAMAKAQADAMNAAAFQSIGMGQQEMMNQGQLASQYGQLGQGYQGVGLNAFGQSYLPMEQQLNALQVGGQAADRFQTGQLTGTGYGAQLGLGGIQSQINAENSAAQLFGNVFGAGMNAIGGIGNTAVGNATSGAGGIVDDVTGIWDAGKGLWDSIFGS